ncbi:MAG: hypothetical protein JRJ26_19950 [Deltaproteobacteria bacterium]|nr:hypothetical protein [Deltaproteobacteria bacterium]
MEGRERPTESVAGGIKEVSWWTFYTLFLLITLFLLSLMVRALIGGALGKISNFGQAIYLVGLLMTVLGLLGLCLAYIVRVMWYRLKDRRQQKQQADGRVTTGPLSDKRV